MMCVWRDHPEKGICIEDSRLKDIKPKLGSGATLKTSHFRKATQDVPASPKLDERSIPLLAVYFFCPTSKMKKKVKKKSKFIG